MSVPAGNKIALTIEYDGTGYYGFQWQPRVTTVQAVLEKAIRQLTGERRRVVAASRTDTGVHALGQVVSFRIGKILPVNKWVSGLNHFLPADVAVRGARRIPESANVQRDAVSREYRYCILCSPVRSPLWRGRCYQIRGELDTAAMNRGCEVLLGECDLASLASDLEPGEVAGTLRTVYRAGVEMNEGLIHFNIMADAFLRHQVRNTVGALISIGRGRLGIAEFTAMLEARQIGLIGPAAPAEGLYLMRVNYTGPLEGMD